MGLLIFVGIVVGGFIGVSGGVCTVNSVGLLSVRLDFSGVAMFYSWGAGLFLIAG